MGRFGSSGTRQGTSRLSTNVQAPAARLDFLGARAPLFHSAAAGMASTPELVYANSRSHSRNGLLHAAVLGPALREARWNTNIGREAPRVALRVRPHRLATCEIFTPKCRGAFGASSSMSETVRPARWSRPFSQKEATRGVAAAAEEPAQLMPKVAIFSAFFLSRYLSLKTGPPPDADDLLI